MEALPNAYRGSLEYWNPELFAAQLYLTTVLHCLEGYFLAEFHSSHQLRGLTPKTSPTTTGEGSCMSVTMSQLDIIAAVDLHANVSKPLYSLQHFEGGSCGPTGSVHSTFCSAPPAVHSPSQTFFVGLTRHVIADIFGSFNVSAARSYTLRQQSGTQTPSQWAGSYSSVSATSKPLGGCENGQQPVFSSEKWHQIGSNKYLWPSPFLLLHLQQPPFSHHAICHIPIPRHLCSGISNS